MTKHTKIILLVTICLWVVVSCIEKQSLINIEKPSNGLPNIAGNTGGVLGNEAMIDKLLKMFWFMCILNILLTWAGVLWVKRVWPWVKAWWLSIIVNILILGLWELFVWFGWSPAHWKDVFVVGLVSWYAQARLYDQLNIKQKLSGKKQ